MIFKCGRRTDPGAIYWIKIIELTYFIQAPGESEVVVEDYNGNQFVVKKNDLIDFEVDSF